LQCRSSAVLPPIRLWVEVAPAALVPAPCPLVPASAAVIVSDRPSAIARSLSRSACWQISAARVLAWAPAAAGDRHRRGPHHGVRTIGREPDPGAPPARPV
jgi:hypothetical protein